MATYTVDKRKLLCLCPWLGRKHEINASPGDVDGPISISDCTDDCLSRQLTGTAQGSGDPAMSIELWVKLINPLATRSARGVRRQEEQPDIERETAGLTLKIASAGPDGLRAPIGDLLSDPTRWPERQERHGDVEAVVVVTRLGKTVIALTIKITKNGALVRLIREFQAQEEKQLPPFERNGTEGEQ